MRNYPNSHTEHMHHASDRCIRSIRLGEMGTGHGVILEKRGDLLNSLILQGIKKACGYSTVCISLKPQSDLKKG